MTFNRGDIAWTYDVHTREVRPVIVLKVPSLPTALGDTYFVLWGTEKRTRYRLYASALQAQAVMVHNHGVMYERKGGYLK